MALFWADLLSGLQNSDWAVAIRQSAWLYPALEVMHLVGISLLTGAAFMFDLRLLGFSRHLPVSQLADHVLPWSRRGLWLVVPSGLLLFITNAPDLAANNTFWLKMGLFVAAGLNAGLFHLLVYRSVSVWEIKSSAPPAAQVAAISSIILWLAIIACGRWLAY